MGANDPQTYNDDLLNEQARKVAAKAMAYLESVNFAEASPERIVAASDALTAAAQVIDATFEDDGDDVVAIH